MAPSIFRLPPHSVEEDREFAARHEKDVEQLVPLAGPLLGVVVILFSAWDFWIDPAHAHIALMFRVAFVGVASIAFRSSRLPWTPTQRAGFMHWMYSLAVFSATFVLDQGLGLLYGMVGVVVGTFLTAIIAVRTRTFICITLPPFGVFSILAWLHVSAFQFINSVLFYALALGITLLLMYLVRFMRWKAFLLERELSELARHDGLTGLSNRDYITELAMREIARAERNGRPLSIAMLDIDHFKKVNDTYGHAAGDRVLKTLAGICLANVRQIDHVGRLGGEEFVCILPETTAGEALACAERLRQAIEAATIETDAGPVRITVSIGLALYPDTGSSWEPVLKAADTALYDAKRQGRNRVVLALPARIPVDVKVTNR